jgi:hypothetical protein
MAMARGCAVRAKHLADVWIVIRHQNCLGHLPSAMGPGANGPLVLSSLSFVQAQHYRVALESRTIRKLNHKSEMVRIRLRGLEGFMRGVVWGFPCPTTDRSFPIYDQSKKSSLRKVCKSVVKNYGSSHSEAMRKMPREESKTEMRGRFVGFHRCPKRKERVERSKITARRS